MSEIVFPVSTAPGINPGESGGRLINSQVENAPAGSRSKFIWRPVPGLRSTTAVGSASHRGALKFGSELIVINGDDGYSLNSAYVATSLTGDAVPGTGRVIMARNMRATPQIIVVTDNGQVKIESGAIATFVDGDLPAANSVCFKDGFFFWGIGDGRCFASAINDVTVSSLDWTRAESSPDGLVRVYSFANGIALGGENTTELFQNTANPTGFPFTRSAVLPYGLFGKFAVTGFEEGFTGDVMTVANDGSVQMLIGLGMQRISPPDLEALINAIEDRDSLFAYSYVTGGHPVYGLTCAAWTWEFSPASINAPAHWRERQSISQLNWRGGITVNAFDRWLALDSTGDEILRLEPGYRWEGDNQLVWEVRSTQAHRFPGRAEIVKASFDLKTGVGIDAGIDLIETDPCVEISWSDNGGINFGNALQRPLGTQGDFTNKITINRCGLTRQFGRQWKLRVSDPVTVALYGGAMDVRELLA